MADRTSDGIHPITFMFNYMRTLGIKAIPTTGLDRDNNYNSALSEVITKDRRGACIRVLGEDMLSPDESENEIKELLEKISISANEANLLLDFRELNINNLDFAIAKTVELTNQLQNIKNWKTLIVAASSYPQSLGEIKTDTEAMIPRTEFTLWNSVMKSSEINRMPSYGDYGIVHPILPELDPRIIKPSAKIRYTLKNEWLIIKGHSVFKHPGFRQFHNLAQDLISREEYIRSDFSWGDDYIFQCAKYTVSTGNLQTWVTVDTNHHLTFVSEQIANAA